MLPLFFSLILVVARASPTLPTVKLPTNIQLSAITHLKSSQPFISQFAPPAIDVPIASKIRLALHSNNLKTTARMTGKPASWVQGGPCGPTEIECMSVKMLEYVNELRAKKNIPVLKPFKNGAERHLQNAMMHSTAMKKRGKIYHQKLPEVDLGCDAFFSGENVAVNHCLLGPKNQDGELLPTDPARMCVKQFIESPPHRKNLENPTHQTAVMGVLMADDGYMWCTQTFGQSTKFTTSGLCKRVDGVQDPNSPISREAPTPTPSPSSRPKKALNNVSSTGHKFGTLEFHGQFPDGRIQKFNLKCTERECRYCTTDGGCLGEEQSVGIDKRITAKR